MSSLFQNSLLLTLPATLYAQLIPLAIPEGPNALLANQFDNNAEAYDFLYEHGCFCSKIFDLTADFMDKSLRGGYEAVDEVDKICQKWLRARECDSNLINGECYAVDFDNRFYDSTDCSMLSDACDKNACLTDEFYFQSIVDLINDNTFNGQLEFTQVRIDQTSTQSCSHSLTSSETKYCTGTAPFLSVTNQSPVPFTINSFTRPFNLVEMTENVKAWNNRDYYYINIPSEIIGATLIQSYHKEWTRNTEFKVDYSPAYQPGTIYIWFETSRDGDLPDKLSGLTNFVKLDQGQVKMQWSSGRNGGPNMEIWKADLDGSGSFIFPKTGNTQFTGGIAIQLQ